LIASPGRASKWAIALFALATLSLSQPAGAALLDYEYGGALAQLGRLRMLVERLSKQNVLYQLHLAGQSKIELIDTASKIQETLDLLHAGRPLMVVPEPPTEEIRKQLRQIDAAWVPVQRMARASPFEYLRRSREFIDPKDDRGDPLMILYFDDLARQVVLEADRTSELYIKECKREGWERCEFAGVAGIPGMLVERIMKEALLVFAGLESEKNRARLAATRKELDAKLQLTGSSSVMTGAISSTRGKRGEAAAALWKDIESAWRRLGDELELVARGQAEERNLQQAASVQILLVADMQRLAVELYQHTKEGG
jgi:hypothetical protein